MTKNLEDTGVNKMNNQDLFGFAKPDNSAYNGKNKRRLVARGYAATPGTGPDGETCKTCGHHYYVEYSKRYHKCDLVKATCSVATDIRVRSPACHRWEKIVDSES